MVIVEDIVEQTNNIKENAPQRMISSNHLSLLSILSNISLNITFSSYEKTILKHHMFDYPNKPSLFFILLNTSMPQTFSLYVKTTLKHQMFDYPNHLSLLLVLSNTSLLLIIFTICKNYTEASNV